MNAKFQRYLEQLNAKGDTSMAVVDGIIEVHDSQSTLRLLQNLAASLQRQYGTPGRKCP